jgi:hypothetical protein
VTAVCLLSAFALACGDSDGDDSSSANGAPAASRSEETVAELEQTLKSTLEAYSSGDTQAFLAHWTDDGLQDAFDASRDKISSSPERFFGGPPLRLIAVSRFNAKVDDDKASTEAELALGKSLKFQRFHFAREAEAWKIDEVEDLKVTVPRGTATADVDLDEYSFEFDVGKIKSGNIAFETKNIGAQPHELVVVRMAPGATLLQFLESPDLPPGSEFIGMVGPLGPDKEANLVFTEALSPGKYAFVCFLPDTDDPAGTPHALKGMATEVVIP